MQNSSITERLTAFGMLHRLIRHYGIEWFNTRGAKMLGGDRYTKSEHQEPRTFLKYANTFNSVDIKFNKLLPAIKIQIVLPIHLLLGRELFCMDLATESPIDVKITFAKIETVIEHRAAAVKLEPLVTDVALYVSSVRPNEDDYVFDRMPYSLNTENRPYYTADVYVDSSNKSFQISAEQSVVLKPKITKSSTCLSSRRCSQKAVSFLVLAAKMPQTTTSADFSNFSTTQKMTRPGPRLCV